MLSEKALNDCPLFLYGIVLLTALGCETDSKSNVMQAEVATAFKCEFRNPFSQEAECKQYTGTFWTQESAQADCDIGQYEEPGTFTEGTCAIDSILGTCRVESDPTLAFTLSLGGNNPDFCSTTARACVNFIGGSFEIGPVCAGQYVDTPPIDGEALVFEWPTQSCVPPLDGEPEGQSENGEVCTWNLISGCTEEGRQFFEYGSCETVWTNRPYYPVPGRAVAGDDDPRRADSTYLEESAWVKSQVEACACICCHTERSPMGPAKWSTDAGPLWVDTMSDTAISLFAGYVDSSALGAFDPADNNGFDRINSALPSTDVARMLAFFQGEFERREIDVAFAEMIRPIGGPLVEQRHYEPEACEDGAGIDQDGLLKWTKTEDSARYIYVLEAGASNPGIPPNFDLPDGTVWRIDVASTDAPMPSGSVRYGAVPEGASQSYPRDGAMPSALESGREYYLYVLKDVGFVLERCLFTAP
ncbi:MAG: proteinase inhibitor [Bradymonadia bacterium]